MCAGHACTQIYTKHSRTNTYMMYYTHQVTQTHTYPQYIHTGIQRHIKKYTAHTHKCMYTDIDTDRQKHTHVCTHAYTYTYSQMHRQTRITHICRYIVRIYIYIYTQREREREIMLNISNTCHQQHITHTIRVRPPYINFNENLKGIQECRHAGNASLLSTMQ